MKKKAIYFLLMSIVILTGCDELTSKELIESVKSPNEKYEIKTYLLNCGATCDFSVSAELCTTESKCKEIYQCEHERLSFVYWIDDENIFINQKKLNVFKDKYNCIDYTDAFHLENITSQEIYLINKMNDEYKLSGEDVYYIYVKATSMFNFDQNNTYSDYDFIMKMVDLQTKETTKYFLKIDNNKMYIINRDKLNELNRTDYEYLKKILVANDLYNFY